MTSGPEAKPPHLPLGKTAESMCQSSRQSEEKARQISSQHSHHQEQRGLWTQMHKLVVNDLQMICNSPGPIEPLEGV